MGYYINPETETKEQFLAREGVELPPGTPTGHIREDSDKAVVCLVDNGLFTAAGVVVDDRELAAFTEPQDYRPKRWFLVPKNKLVSVTGPRLPWTVANG